MAKIALEKTISVDRQVFLHGCEWAFFLVRIFNFFIMTSKVLLHLISQVLGSGIISLESIGLRDPTFLCTMYIPFLTGHTLRAKYFWLKMRKKLRVALSGFVVGFCCFGVLMSDSIGYHP